MRLKREGGRIETSNPGREPSLRREFLLSGINSPERSLTRVDSSIPLWRDQPRPLGGYFNLLFWLGALSTNLLCCDLEMTLGDLGPLHQCFTLNDVGVCFALTSLFSTSAKNCTLATSLCVNRSGSANVRKTTILSTGSHRAQLSWGGCPVSWNRLLRMLFSSFSRRDTQQHPWNFLPRFTPERLLSSWEVNQESNRRF